MTAPLMERRVLTGLKAEGHEGCSPEWVESSGRVGRMFPRYVFVKWTGWWWSLKRLPGVACVMMGMPNGRSEPAPALLGDELVAGYVAASEENARQRPPEALSKDFEKGQSVKIVSGPFAGQVGVFKGLTGQERVSILLKMFGTETRVSAAKKDLVAA